MERLRCALGAPPTLALVALLALGLSGCAGGGVGAGHASHPGASPPGANTPVTATRAPGSSTTTLTQWTVVVSPPRGTFALQFAPAEPQMAYLCAIDGPAVAPLAHTARLYKSVDGARTWSLVPHTPVMRPVSGGEAPTLAMCGVVIDARDARDARDIFFQQTQFQPVGAGFAVARALYRSRDGGATWTALTEPNNTDGFETLAVYGSRLIARPKPSVFGAAPCDATKPAPRPSSLVDASDDGGQTWRPIGQSLMAEGYSLSDMASAGAALFVTAYQVPDAACQEVSHWTIFRSDDAGATWRPTAISAPSLTSLSFTPKMDGSDYYGVALTPASDNSGAWQVYFSDDSGISWRAEPALAPTTAGVAPNIIAAPSGALFAQAAAASALYRLAPDAPAPAWTPYGTVNNSNVSDYLGVWMVEPQRDNDRLWSVVVSYGSTPVATLAYLPLR